jgi:hypothetical protein
MLPPALRAKYEASKVAGKNHPLYETEAARYGKAPRGAPVAPLCKPVAAKSGDFSCHFLDVKLQERNTGLATSKVKSRFMKELDP